jgi:hypothetical protein
MALSSGMLSVLSIATVVSARKVWGFSERSVTVPTLTPASRTSLPTEIPSTERKLARRS